MKKYSHAWLAMMAIKRLEKAAIPKNYRSYSQSLHTWFMNHRDFVTQGAWYPDAIIKDMATSHVLKYEPGNMSRAGTFKKLPREYHLYEMGKLSPQYGKDYAIVKGNLPDRCEAIAHSIIDNLKMQESEDKGSPIAPTDNHVATLFYMLSHYVADAHMPLHSDVRQFSSEDNIHAHIEKEWDEAIRDCYDIDFDNDRFFYDKHGYPLKKGSHPMIDWIENEIESRKFSLSYGSGNNNTWDFMSAITQYSYLTAYEMIPKGYNEDNLDWDTFKTLQTNYNFEDYSKYLLMDAIDSISKIWLRVWRKYVKWLKD